MSGATKPATPRSKGEAKTKTSTKPVIKVDSSFTAPTWPTIDPAQQDIILKLLCDLLEPVGQHRFTYITPSKGKHDKKRKRTPGTADHTQEGWKPVQMAIPPSPMISKHITLGYNSTFRHLHATIKLYHPQGAADTETPSINATPVQNHVIKMAETEKENHHAQEVETTLQTEVRETKSAKPEHLLAIFLTASNPSTHVPYTPLPLLALLASSHHPKSLPTRIIPLSPTSETKLCAALRIPRVGIIGVFEDAPGATGLLEYIRQNVNAVEVPWLMEVREGEWLGTAIMFGEESRKV